MGKAKNGRGRKTTETHRGEGVQCFGKVARGLTESMSAECEGMGASKKHAWEGGLGPEEER